MADNNTQLDEGFTEVPLDEGFQEVPISGQTPSLPTEDTVHPLMSGIAGVAQGGTLGFADEITGAVRGGLAALQGEEGSLPELYAKYRDLTRSSFEKAEKDNPNAYLAGELGSALVPGLGPLKLAKGAVKGGLMAGALAGLGSSKADLTKGEVGDAAVDTAIGAGLGAAGGYVGQKIGKFFTTADKIEGRLQGLLTDADKKLAAIPEDQLRLKAGSALDKARDAVRKKTAKFSEYPPSRAEAISKELEESLIHYDNKIEAAGNSLEKLNKVKREMYDYITNDLDRLAYDEYAPDFSKQKASEVLKTMAGAVKDHIEKLGSVAGKDVGSQIKETNRHLGYLINRGKIEAPKGLGISDVLSPKKALYKTSKNILNSPEGVSAQEKLAGLGEKYSMGKLEKAGLPAGIAGAVTAKEQTAGETDASALSKAMYHADDEKLNRFIGILGTDPEFEKVSKNLAEAISTGDRNKKNAALFAIAQKAKARELFKGME